MNYFTILAWMYHVNKLYNFSFMKKECIIVYLVTKSNVRKNKGGSEQNFLDSIKDASN